MNRIVYATLVVFTGISMVGCKGLKLIAKRDRIYVYEDNEKTRINHSQNPLNDSFIVYHVKKPFKAAVVPNVAGDFEYDYFSVTKKKIDTLVAKGIITKVETESMVIKPPETTNLGFTGKPFYPEIKHSIDRKPFRYYDMTFGVQAMTVPLKVRKALSNDSLYPRQVETGFNVGFAPGLKFNYYVFNPFDKFLGKHLKTFSATPGLLLSLGTAGLKKASNAPGLPTVDRTSLTYTYGGYFVFGLDNINIGLAVGWDKLLDNGKKYWVYQGKQWYGIIVSLDVLKF